MTSPPPLLAAETRVSQASLEQQQGTRPIGGVFSWRGVALFCPAWLWRAGGRAGSGIEKSDVNARKKHGDVNEMRACGVRSGGAEPLM